MNKRVAFFLIAAFACFLLVPAAESSYRFVPEWLAITYLVLAALAGLDALGRRRR